MTPDPLARPDDDGAPPKSEPARPRFEVLSLGDFYQLRDRVTPETVLACFNATQIQADELDRVAILLNNAYPMPPERPREAPCRVCGFPPGSDNPDCPSHALRPMGGPR